MEKGQLKGIESVRVFEFPVNHITISRKSMHRSDKVSSYKIPFCHPLSLVQTSSQAIEGVGGKTHGERKEKDGA
jgi:hypothetical protein